MNTNEAFKRAYDGHRGVNFVTPNFIRQGKRGNLHFELSTGRDIYNQALYGVTVVEETGNTAIRRHDLSQVFEDRNDAENFIKELCPLILAAYERPL